MVMDMGRLEEMLRKGMVDGTKLMNVMNFYVTYIIQNMQI
jgi:hypothetical protein